MPEPVKLDPAESLALTVARNMVQRGDNPHINTTTMLVMTLDRLLALPAEPLVVEPDTTRKWGECAACGWKSLASTSKAYIDLLVERHVCPAPQVEQGDSPCSNCGEPIFWYASGVWMHRETLDRSCVSEAEAAPAPQVEQHGCTDCDRAIEFAGSEEHRAISESAPVEPETDR